MTAFCRQIINCLDQAHKYTNHFFTVECLGRFLADNFSPIKSLNP